MIVAGMVMAVFPEVGRFFDMVVKDNAGKRRQTYKDLLLASRLPRRPPYLTDSIKLQSIDRLENALRYIRRSRPDATKNDRTITQSNNAVSEVSEVSEAGAFVPILDALKDREDRTGLWSPNAFPDLGP